MRPSVHTEQGYCSVPEAVKCVAHIGQLVPTSEFAEWIAQLVVCQAAEVILHASSTFRIKFPFEEAYIRKLIAQLNRLQTAVSTDEI